MFAPSVLLLLSVIAIGATIALPGLEDYRFLAGVTALASLLLLVFKWVRQYRSAKDAAQNWIVVDGSNVMHWNDGTPQIGTVRKAVDHVRNLGYQPVVFFDANAGHLTTGKYRHHQWFSMALGLSENRVMVVDKGTPADPYILITARDLEAQIVTNDRFRDWIDAHPEVHEKGRLIRGSYREGKLWLHLGPARQPDDDMPVS